MVNKNKNLLSEILNEIKRQNSWLKLQNIDVIKSHLKDLDKDQKRVFHYTDGQTSMREVAEHTEYNSHSPVQTLIKKWKRLGLVFTNEDGKWEHLGSLEDFGLDVPDSAKDKNRS